MTDMEIIQVIFAGLAVPAAVILVHDLLSIHANLMRTGRYKRDRSLAVELIGSIVILSFFVMSLFII